MAELSYRVSTPEEREAFFAESRDLAGIPQPVKRAKLWRGFSETIFENYPRVILDNRLMNFVGIGWVDEREATPDDYLVYPEAID